MIRPSLLPSARAASAYSRSRKLKNIARTIRATGGQLDEADDQDDRGEVERSFVRRLCDDRGQHQEQRQERNREHDVGDPHDGEVDDPAVVAGDRAEHCAERDLHRYREDRDRQRDLRAEDQTREQIATILVSAENVPGDAGREDSRSSAAGR